MTRDALMLLTNMVFAAGICCIALWVLVSPRRGLYPVWTFAGFIAFAAIMSAVVSP